MKTFSKPLFALCLLFLPLSLSAQHASEASQKMSQIFKEIPIQEQLDETAMQMQDFFSQNPFQVQASQNEKLIKLFSEAYQADSLRDAAQTVFSQNHQPEFADSTLTWIQQEHTQKVLTAEKEYYTLQGMRKRIVHRYELEQNPPTQNRINVIKSLAEKRALAKSEVQSRMIMFDAMLSALNEMNNQSIGSMQMQNISGSYRMQLQAQIDQELTDQLLVMYYELNNETLRNYGSFYESESGHWLSNITATSSHSAYEEAADRFQRALKN